MSERETVVEFPVPDVVENEAAQWVVRLDGDDVSAEDCRRFEAWQNLSPRHRAAFERLSALWADCDRLKPAEAGVVRPTRVWVRLAYAAAVLVAVMAAGWFYARPPQVIPHPVAPVLYETAVGARRTVALADGTRLHLNTGSKVSVTVTGHDRTVRLYRGEVYFEVAHDADRPFTVFAGGRVLHDVGTAFDVRVLQTKAEVTVTEGMVELTPPTPEATRPSRLLRAGQFAVVDPNDERFGALSPEALDRRLSWRRGVLIYAGEPLAKVVEDFSRYTDTRIEIDDEALKVTPVGGYFEIGKLDALFVALEKNFGIRVVRIGAHRVRLLPGRNRDARSE